MSSPTRAGSFLPSPLFLLSLEFKSVCQGSGKQVPARWFWNCPLGNHGGPKAIPEDRFASGHLGR